MSLLQRLAASALSPAPTQPKSSASLSPAQQAVRRETASYLNIIGIVGAPFGFSAEGIITKIAGNDPVETHAKLVEFIAKAQQAIAEDHEQGICGCQQCVAAPKGEPQSAAG